MNNLHFRRWSDQLRNSGHEIFWFDILDQGYALSLEWMTQITGWKKGFLKTRGRTFLKRKLPKIYYWLAKNFDHKVDKAFKKALLDIQPDVVHSFALQIGCLPILSVMQANSHVKWIYSSWGTDLYKPELVDASKLQLKHLLKRVDYLITDNDRDFKIAKSLGFKNQFLGVFPGNGGTDFGIINFNPVFKNGILIKANQDQVGRGDLIAKAICNIKDQLLDIPVYFIGASDHQVYEQFADWPLVSIFKRSCLVDPKELDKIYSKCFLYIAVSISDGTPNMLIEALGNGLYAIQSNPSHALDDLILENVSGNLVPVDITAVELELYILKAIKNKSQLVKNTSIESQRIRKLFDVSRWNSLIHNFYNDIEQDLSQA